MATPRLSTVSQSSASVWCLLLAAVLLAGCDSGTNETIILSDPLNPTETSFEFAYSEDDLSGGVIQVASLGRDELSSVLSAYGYSRSDVVSARVTAVTMERLTVNQPSAQPKVFNYLTTAEVYYGSSTDAPLIGEFEGVTTDAEVDMELGPGTTVTSQVQNGPTSALLLLDVGDPNLIGGGGDRVRVDVRFRIEVQP
jgi:hypothetical protein